MSVNHHLTTSKYCSTLCVNLLPLRSSDSITPLLKQLHWLRVSYCIKY